MVHQYQQLKQVSEERKKTNNHKWYKSLKRKFWSYININYKLHLIIFFGFLIVTYFLYYLTHYLFLKNHFDPEFGTDGKSCPACFGNKACPYFFQGEINIKGINRLPFIQKLKTRQIFESYHGLYHRKTDVIIKKLATHSEHEETDLRICNVNRYRNVEGKCYPKHALWSYLDYHPSKEMQLAHLAQTRNTAPMMYCVTERLFNRIKTKYQERDSKNTELPLSRHEEILLLYTLNLNQQPLVLQLFPKQEGWPFPRYLGACGRWTVESNAGLGFNSFCYGGKFWQKLTILLNLMKLSIQLDKSATDLGEWSLYLGDADPENFMIDPVTFQVTIVDVEHLLVVDIKHLRDIQMENSNEPLHVKADPCGTGLTSQYFNCTAAFDKSSLCGHEFSDHNIHAICAMLISNDDQNDGPSCLLKDERLGSVRELLRKCVFDVSNRVGIRDSIIVELDQLLHVLKKEDL